MPLLNLMRKRGWQFSDENPDIVLVSSYRDLLSARASGTRRIVYMEHGSGQSYTGVPSELANFYVGGEREGCIGILVPGRLAEEKYEISQLGKWSTKCPPIKRIGCPKLVSWKPTAHDPSKRIRVGLSFHWDCPACPETSATWHQWLPVIERLKSTRYKTCDWVAFCHPRSSPSLIAQYEKLGIEICQTDPVSAGVNLMLVDNSSIGFEFMNFGRSVLWLNGIQYRKSVNHGLRFPGSPLHFSCTHSGSVAEALKNLDWWLNVWAWHSELAMNTFPGCNFTIKDVYEYSPEDQHEGNLEAVEFMESLC